MSDIRIYSENEIEYQKLNTFVNLCNNYFASHGVNHAMNLENIYFDYGQNWWYTSPITHNLESNSDILGYWQSLCPRDYKLVIHCDSFDKISDYVRAYVDSIRNNGDRVDFSVI